MAGKPRHRSGYTPQDTAAVRAACLTVASTLGSHLDNLCIVGGYVPSLLIDQSKSPGVGTELPHPGTQDLDVALDIGLLDESQYTEISDRLRREGFTQDVNERGNPTPQRWVYGPLNVTVDFLMAPVPGSAKGLRIHKLEGDFGAVVTPGLTLAFDERQWIEIDGSTMKGEATTRTIPVCGPGAFTILKALALHDRGEPKDAFDIVYVLRRWPGGVDDIASRLAHHHSRDSGLIKCALAKLEQDFASVDHIGPRRAAEFELGAALLE